MTSFALITEGITDQVVLEYILDGLSSGDAPPPHYARYVMQPMQAAWQTMNFRAGKRFLIF